MTTTVTVEFGNFCPAEGHVTVNVTLQGGGTRSFNYETTELRAALTWDEAEPVIKTIIKAHMRGLTAPQARAEIMTGFVVTL